MDETFDIYSDSFLVSLNAWGASLTFHLTDPHPSPDVAREPVPLGTIRMSIEHLKVLAYMLRQYVISHEDFNDVDYDVPDTVLSQIGISRADWEASWDQEDE